MNSFGWKLRWVVWVGLVVRAVHEHSGDLEVKCPPSSHRTWKVIKQSCMVGPGGLENGNEKIENEIWVEHMARSSEAFLFTANWEKSQSSPIEIRQKVRSVFDPIKYIYILDKYHLLSRSVHVREIVEISELKAGRKLTAADSLLSSLNFKLN